MWSLIALARPKGTIGFLVVPLTGYGFAHWDFMLELTRPGALGLVLVAWMLLSSGTLWLNAALDGEEEGALFAKAVAHPPHLALWGYAALAAAVAIAFAADVRAGECCAAGAVLAVLYSHPRTAWKGHPLLGPAVNATGYGVLSWIAGASVTHVPMTARTTAAMLLLTTYALGMSFGAQAYQRDDDARRGYRTFVVTHGPRACLAVTAIATCIPIAGVAILAALDVYPRIVLFGLPVFALAARTMVRWWRAPNGGTPAHAAELAMRMLLGGLVMVALVAFDALRA